MLGGDRCRASLWPSLRIRFRKLLRLLSGTNETILDVLWGGVLHLRKLVVAVCSWGRGAEGSTVEAMWGACGVCRAVKIHEMKINKKVAWKTTKNEGMVAK